MRIITLLLILLLFSGNAWAEQNNKLILKSISCQKSTNFFANDLKLEIIADDSQVTNSPLYSLSQSDNREIGLTINFSNTVKIRLWKVLILKSNELIKEFPVNLNENSAIIEDPLGAVYQIFYQAQSSFNENDQIINNLYFQLGQKDKTINELYSRIKFLEDKYKVYPKTPVPSKYKYYVNPYRK